MCTFDEALNSMWHGDFVTRRGWQDKTNAIRFIKPYSSYDETIGHYKNGIYQKDYTPSEDDKKATDWLAISNREAKEGDENL